MALSLTHFFRWISHGEDAVSVASATMLELTARLLTVPSCAHIAAMMITGQVCRKRSDDKIECHRRAVSRVIPKMFYAYIQPPV
jgi:hypothetical protein